MKSDSESSKPAGISSARDDAAIRGVIAGRRRSRRTPMSTITHRREARRAAALPWLTLSCLLAFVPPSTAQIGPLLDALKGRFQQQIEPPEGGVAGGGRTGQREPPGAGTSFDFEPGDAVLLQDDFGAIPAGRLPPGWKTNGSGRVVTLPGVAGKWLELQPLAAYKLSHPPELPAKFTLEFDVVAAADRVTDLSVFSFGFARDNSIGGSTERAINEVNLQEQNGGGGFVIGQATGVSHAYAFDLTGFANRPLRASITVDGDNMRVYLDKTKIADARLFDSNAIKYFYLAAPVDANDNGARILVGNFRIAAFR